MSRLVSSALFLAALFGLWELFFAAFMADDLLHLAILEGMSPSSAWTGPFSLYVISDGDPAHVLAMKDAGFFPWFFDPRFEMGFFRPLSSALFVFDHWLFGLRPVGYRLHGVLWSLVLVAAVTAVFQRSLPQRMGRWATIVFVVSAIQGIFSWIAARHVVIAAALGMLALLAHMKWREDGWRLGRVVAPTMLVLSLAASEVGVAVAAYLFSYELLAASGDRRSRGRAVTPVLIVVAVYLLVWPLLGNGASRGAGYLDPFTDPLAFARELPGRLAVLTGGVILGGGADLWVLLPHRRTGLIAAALVVTFGFVILMRPTWIALAQGAKRGIRWLGVGAILSAIPFAGTPIGARCLLVPFIGGAALLAAVIDRWWCAWRSEPKGRFRPFALACLVVVTVHLVVAPLGRLAMPILLKHGMADRAAATLREAEIDAATIATQHIVVLRAPDLIVGLHGGADVILRRAPRPLSRHVLSWAAAPHQFSRTGVDTIEMAIAGPGIESVSLRVGTVVTMRDFQATVLETGRLGPIRVRFRFNAPLDDPSMTLLAWHDGRLRRVVVPAVGGEISTSRFE